MKPRWQQIVAELGRVLDAYAGRYRELNGAATFAEYLAGASSREDEEMLTEPVLADVIEQVLGFPRDAYFPQRGRSGTKPDFTPNDLVEHSFVLDAKSSTQELSRHEQQIRRYIDQRHLDFGVLFNLRRLAVYRRGGAGPDPEFSFDLLPLWQLARGEAMAGPEADRFVAFHDRFRFRALGTADKIAAVQRATAWSEREQAGEELEVDIEFLVDRLRSLSAELTDDVAAQRDTLDQTLDVMPGLRRRIVAELDQLAFDIEPRRQPSANVDLSTFRDAAAGTVESRAWRQYLVRVAQLALIRLVLYRSWEDVGFVEDCLHDGGFGQAYERLGQRMRGVLDEAFMRGRDRYPWLYGGDNTYDWYRPRDDVLVDVLYALAPVPLGKLDADALGGLYESYVDDIDRDRLGQFYTPRSVVKFMLDRAGFAGPEVVVVEGDERRAKTVLDFATGSGGFLVEAARRVIDQVGTGGSARDASEALGAIVRGFVGSEISPFPYYLTEVNLLLQVSRLLGRLRALDAPEPAGFVLGVVHADTLTAKTGGDVSIEGLAAHERADRAELAEDERFGLVPLDAEKREAYRRMRADAGFDLVVGNPPYVAEANNKVLFDRLRTLPAWTDVYRGKSDYLYYFLWLAAEKVAPGGRLSVITPAGWMNAGNADWLRERLAGTLRLDELYLFGSYLLFAPEAARRDRRAPTPTVESAILIATKADAPRGHELKVVALEDEAAAAAALNPASTASAPDRDALLAAMAGRAAGRAGRSKGLHVHRIRQRDLRHDRPWPIKHGKRDVAARVAAAIEPDGAAIEPLSERWVAAMGIETGADAYTRKMQRRLSPEAQASAASRSASVGDPILELPPGRERDAPWRDSPDFLAHSPEPEGVLYGAIDPVNYSSLVWIGRDTAAPYEIVAALEPWRAVLRERAEFKRNPRRRWFETAWPRDRRALLGPKVIALHRTDRGRFALDEDGTWQPSKKTAVVTPKEPGLSVAYLCGLLNSELLDLWYSVLGRTPRDVWRDYEPKPMSRMPYRHVAAPTPTSRTKALAGHLDSGDAEAAAALAGEIAAALADDPALDGEAAEALAQIVRALAANRLALLPWRAGFPNLGAQVKDPWNGAPPSPSRAALAAGLPAAATVSVRLDPALNTGPVPDGPVGRPRLAEGRLEFRRARERTLTVAGPADRLALLHEIATARPKLLGAEAAALMLPKDLDAFDREVADATAEVARLVRTGRMLVEAAERLVCRLYGIPPDLEDDVVAHAVQRARR